MVQIAQSCDVGGACFTPLSEINRRLQVVNSLLSPEHQTRRPSRRGPGRRNTTTDDGIIIVDNDRIAVNLDESDDDVIAITPDGSPHAPSVREIPLKVRCRTDVHKIHVLPVRNRRHLSCRINATPDR